MRDQVRIIDPLPTIVATAGYRGPLAVQGRDLGPLLRRQTLPPRDILAEFMRRKTRFDEALGNREPNSIEVPAALASELERLGYLDGATSPGDGS